MHRLLLEHLTKSYDGRKVVDDITLEVNSGEVVGLLGPNGAGKTTTFYMVLGLEGPDRLARRNHAPTVTGAPYQKL